MTLENEISRRRVTGFVALALAAIVGTMAFGTLVGSCQPSIVEPTPSSSAATIGTPTSTVGTATPTPAIQSSPNSPSTTSAPRGSVSMPRIPSFVPIPSGPVP